jgi:hypothetical protein
MCVWMQADALGVVIICVVIINSDNTPIKDIYLSLYIYMYIYIYVYIYMYILSLTLSLYNNTCI